MNNEYFNLMPFAAIHIHIISLASFCFAKKLRVDVDGPQTRVRLRAA